jgi:lactate racemase
MSGQRDLDKLMADLLASPELSESLTSVLAVEDPPPIDLPSMLPESLARPVGTARLRELAHACRTVAIITSDATRATPTADLIDAVMDELLMAGVPTDGIHIIVGTGAHRPANADEMANLLSDRWRSRLGVVNHDACAKDLVEIGLTHRGTPVLLNRIVAQADLRIAFGQVEPHEFAGFTGGRKAILPGVAGYETIVRNHALSMLHHPCARPGILEGNPIHEEMLEAARLASLDFIVNVALDRELRPIAVSCGDVALAHAELVAFLRRHLELTPPEQAPAVIVTGPGEPLNINLYQTVKALVGIEPLLDTSREARFKPVVVVLSECWDGTGSEEMFEPFRAAECPEGGAQGFGAAAASQISRAAMAALEHGYTIEKDESYFIARVTPKCGRIIAWCPGVAETKLESIGWDSASSPREAIVQALESAEVAGHEMPVLLCPRPQRALFVPFRGEFACESGDEPLVER